MWTEIIFNPDKPPLPFPFILEQPNTMAKRSRRNASKMHASIRILKQKCALPMKVKLINRFIVKPNK